MINFYNVWKEDKEYSRKPNRTQKKAVCPLCLSRLKEESSLKAHFKDKHGDADLWLKYLKAKEILRYKPIKDIMDSL